MQIAAHYAAAITILDQVEAGDPAERALLSWARNSRFAGSKDRANIRDIVFDCLRKKRSYQARMGESSRGLILARAAEHGELSEFTGGGYSPEVLSDFEHLQVSAQIKFSNIAEEFDFPDFLISFLDEQYGDLLPSLMNEMRDRAPVDLRVNRLKTDPEEAIALLARDHIFVDKLDVCENALRIKMNPRKLSQSRAFNYGYVELQDVSSQIVSQMAGAKSGMKILDYCAGGGGKTLSLGMELSGKGQIDAWDISAARMKEIPQRAARAGLSINILNEHPTGQYDLVFVDAPCSGSGAWRRSPDAKWKLTEKRLNELIELQAQVLSQASRHVLSGGTLVYATCSLFQVENRAIVDGFLNAQDRFALQTDRNFSPLSEGDGFYGAVMKKLP